MSWSHPAAQDLGMQLNILANSLGRQFQSTKDIHILNRAIELALKAVDATPAEDSRLAGRLNNLGSWLGTRSMETKSVDDLNLAIESGNKALEAIDKLREPTVANDRIKSIVLRNLENLAAIRFEWTQDLADLHDAIKLTDLLMKATPLQDPARNEVLDNLLNLLDARFDRIHLDEDINSALQIIEPVVQTPFQNSTEQARWLNSLGIWLGRRFLRFGALSDIDRAIKVADQAVNATPPGHVSRALYLDTLGIGLSSRFERTENIADINRGVKVTSLAVEAIPPHPDQASALINLANRLGVRFKRNDNLDDLNSAIKFAKKAVDSTPSDSLKRAGRLNNLGVWYGTRFERIGKIGDLNSAIEVLEIAVEASSSNAPGLAGSLQNLGKSLNQRFEKTGNQDDINRSVEVSERAVKVIPPNHPAEGVVLNTLGTALGLRFQRTGATDDLSDSIEATQKAVNLSPSDSPNRARWLASLGASLYRRFELLGSTDDIDRAVKAGELAIKGIPISNHLDQAMVLNILGAILHKRFTRTKKLEDIDRAASLSDMAVNLTSPDHPRLANRMSNLANILGTRYKHTSDISDINRAIDNAKKAVVASSLDNFGRARLLNNAAVWYHVRFEGTQVVDDLNASIDLSTQAVKAIDPDNPDRAGMLNNLGGQLEERHQHTHDAKDLDQAFLSFKEGFDCTNAPVSIRVRVAARAGNILAWESKWEDSYQLFHKAVDLLPKLSPRFLQNTDKQHMLGEFAGLASRAAAVALSAKKDVRHPLELLELGRGVIAGILLEMRTDISRLKEEYPELAKEFISLRDELDSLTLSQFSLFTSNELDDFATSWELQAKRHREADELFKKVIKCIRSREGFDRFLLPPTADELMAEAHEGPIVVINLSPYRCDAFLIEPHLIRTLELPDLSMEAAEKKARLLRSHSVRASSSKIASVLEWLWTVAARPIIEALGYTAPPTDDNWPRIWWVTTGALSHLPLHAAGRHTRGSTETVLDRVMSSYCSTIKTLIHGRRHISVKPAAEHALLVAMEETPGLHTNPFLDYATSEVDILDKLCPAMQLKSVKPELRREAVLAHLRTCRIFHFAGHGCVDPLEPSRSCLLLKDWEDNPLTVGDLRDQSLHGNPPFLAYLSACSTGASETASLVDEGIHLVSAFQLAGFRHVVGTFWEVADEQCVDVARILYETIRDEGMTDKAICRGLHRAIRALRETRLAARELSENLTGNSQPASAIQDAEAPKVTIMITEDGIQLISGDQGVQGSSDGGIVYSVRPQDSDKKLVVRDARVRGYESEDESADHLLYWSPYVHFGV